MPNTLDQRFSLSKSIFERSKKIIFAPDKRKFTANRFASFILTNKAFLLFRSILELLHNSQFSVSAYLVRGLIETRADLYQIITGDDIQAEKFINTFHPIRKAQMEIGNGQTRKFPSDKCEWTPISICERIRIVDDIKNDNDNTGMISWAYDYLSCFCHSSSINIDAVMRGTDEETRCVSEQLFTATHSYLEIIRLFASNSGDDKSKTNIIMERIDELFDKGYKPISDTS